MRLAALGILAALLVEHVARADEDESPWKTSGFVIAAEGGYGLRMLYGVPVDAGVFQATIGARYRWARFLLDGNYLSGRTREGLAVSRWGIGTRFGVAVWRLRVSAGFDIGQITVTRTTSTGGALQGSELSLLLRTDIDVVEWQHDGGVFVGLQLGGNDRLWGPSFLVGVRAF